MTNVPPAEPVRDGGDMASEPATRAEQSSANGSGKAYKNDKSWMKPVLPVAAVTLCAEMGTSVLNNSTLPVYFKYGLGIGTNVIAFIMIPFFVSEVLFKTPLGVLADRIGRKPLMLLGCLMTVLTPMVLKTIHYDRGTSTAVLALLGFGCLRLIDGFGGASLWPSLFAYVGDEVPEEKRSSAMGLLNLMYMVAIAVSFYLAGKLDDNFDPLLTGENSLTGQFQRIGSRMHEMVRRLSGHQASTANLHALRNDLLQQAMSRPAHYFPSMYLVSFLFGLAFLISLFGLRNKKAQTVHGEAEVEGVTWESFVNALHKIPEFLLLAFVTFFGIGCIATLVKTFAIAEFHMTEQKVGLLMLVTATIIAVLAYPLGKLGDTWGKSRSVRLGFALCAVGLWGIPLLHGLHHVHEIAFVVSAAVMGVGFVIAFPAWNAILTSLTDQSHRATVFGAVSTAQGTGMLLGVITGGFLYEHSHIMPFALSAAFVTLAAVLALAFVRDSRLANRI